MAARAEAELAIPASRRRGGDPAPESAVKLASQDMGLEGAERVDGDAAQEGGAAGAATLGAAAGAAAPKPAAEPVGDRAPESVANLASQDLVPGGAERADGVAAQEGRAAGAAMLGAAAGAVAPGPAAEPAGDRAPESDADLAGGAERDGVAAQVNERVDGVAAQEGSVARQQPVTTLMVEGVQSTGRTALRASQFRRHAGSGRRSAPRAHSPSAPSEEGVPVEKSLLDGARRAWGRSVEGVARGARGGAWRARRGGRNRWRERDRRGGGGALARHA